MPPTSLCHTANFSVLPTIYGDHVPHIVTELGYHCTMSCGPQDLTEVWSVSSLV